MYGLYVLIPVFAWLGYREAAKFAENNGGRPPWGLHPGFWALFTGLSLLIGGILLAIARRTTAPPTSMHAPGGAPWSAPSQPYGQVYGQPGPVGDPWAAPASAALPPPLAGDPWAAPGTQPPAPSGQYDASRNILPDG